jgi:hypothetical protein
VVTNFGQPLLRIGVNFTNVRLFCDAVTRVSIKPKIALAKVGLRIFQGPRVDLIFIDNDSIILNPALKLWQLFVVILLRLN